MRAQLLAAQVMYQPVFFAKLFLKACAIMVLRGSPWAQIVAWLLPSFAGLLYTLRHRPLERRSLFLIALLEDAATVLVCVALCFMQGGVGRKSSGQAVVYLLSGAFLLVVVIEVTGLVVTVVLKVCYKSRERVQIGDADAEKGEREDASRPELV